jgi:hypothetical protein
VIRAVASKEDTGKWDTYWLRSFVEENRKMSWWVGEPGQTMLNSIFGNNAWKVWGSRKMSWWVRWVGGWEGILSLVERGVCVWVEVVVVGVG